MLRAARTDSGVPRLAEGGIKFRQGSCSDHVACFALNVMQNPGSAPIAQGAPGAITKSGSGKSGNATPENGHTPRDKEAPEKPAATKQEAVQPTSPSKSQSQSLAFDDRSVRWVRNVYRCSKDLLRSYLRLLVEA